jgi:AcrR family transcriptional regulator
VAARAYRSGRREAQARETRRRILAAGTEVFLARGYAGATMRAVAAAAGVSVPTVEAAFGTKARLLKAAIDVAIAGDDEEVPVLARAEIAAALREQAPQAFLASIAGVLGPAQARSAGLVLAVFEGSTTDAELAAVAGQMTAQRATTAAFIVGALAARAPLRTDLTRQDAVDTLWLLMDPALFHRLTGARGWSLPRYQAWFARSARHLLTPDVSDEGAAR